MHDCMKYLPPSHRIARNIKDEAWERIGKESRIMERGNEEGRQENAKLRS